MTRVHFPAGTGKGFFDHIQTSSRAHPAS